jgi:His-Xaa-Ser repeat protein HxsA
MKTYALIVALALALPGVADARDSHHRSHSHRSHSSSRHHSGHHHHYHGSRSYRYYPSYRSFGYSSYGYPSYGYGSYGYGYGYPYYRSYPSVSFVYSSSSPRYYSSSRAYRSVADSLEVDVQRELKRRGYYRGPIDGDIGPGSRAAIRSYQAERGLAVTGRIDSSLLRSLGI